MIVKLYGGPLHGQTVDFDGPVYSTAEGPQRPVRFGEPYEPVTFTKVNYYPETFREIGHNPKRRRELTVGLIQGGGLTPTQTADLERDWGRVPWEFPKVSFLHDFDNWFAQAVFRHCGLLTWKCKPIGAKKALS